MVACRDISPRSGTVASGLPRTAGRPRRLLDSPDFRQGRVERIDTGATARRRRRRSRPPTRLTPTVSCFPLTPTSCSTAKAKLRPCISQPRTSSSHHRHGRMSRSASSFSANSIYSCAIPPSSSNRSRRPRPSPPSKAIVNTHFGRRSDSRPTAANFTLSFGVCRGDRVSRDDGSTTSGPRSPFRPLASPSLPPRT